MGIRRHCCCLEQSIPKEHVAAVVVVVVAAAAAVDADLEPKVRSAVLAEPEAAFADRQLSSFEQQPKLAEFACN